MISGNCFYIQTFTSKELEWKKKKQENTCRLYWYYAFEKTSFKNNIDKNSAIKSWIVDSNMFLKVIKCILHIATPSLTNLSYLIYENLRWVAWNKVIIPWRFHNLLLFFITSAHYYGKNACLFFAALQSFKEAGFLITLSFSCLHFWLL